MINKPVKNEQACAIIIPGGKWVDITCYHLRPFICEKGECLAKSLSNAFYLFF